MNYKQRLNARDAFVELMEDEYGIKEITSKTQKKNKTRMFEIPSGETFGVYDSGMVRKVFRSRFDEYTCYQLNRCHNQESRAMFLDDDGSFKTRVYNGKGRIPIYGEKARLKYLLEYLKKNYDLKKVAKSDDMEVTYTWVNPKEATRETITVNGITYVRV